MVVAGWAVDDAAAQHFAAQFYEAFVTRGQSFGDAIMRARTLSYEHFGHTNTWGAYQAYGDPSFVLEPQDAVSARRVERDPFVAPEQAVAELELLKDALARRSSKARYDTLPKVKAAVDAIIQRCPEAWRGRGNILFAAAGVYANFGRQGFQQAIEAYLGAVGAPAVDERSYPPIRALERLANYEARASDDEPGVKRAATRLERLVTTLAKEPGDDIDKVPPPSAELCGLIGSSWKKLAIKSLRAPVPASPTQGRAAEALLADALHWYARGASLAGKGHQGRYCEVNRIAMSLVTGARIGDGDFEALEDASRDGYRKVAIDDRFWEAVIPVDLRVYRALRDGALAEQIEGLARDYRATFDAYSSRDDKRDSVVEALRSLAELTKNKACPKPLARQAGAIRDLAQALNLAG